MGSGKKSENTKDKVPVESPKKDAPPRQIKDEEPVESPRKDAPPRPISKMVGLGITGLGLIGGGTYILMRLLHGRKPVAVKVTTTEPKVIPAIAEPPHPKQKLLIADEDPAFMTLHMTGDITLFGLAEVQEMAQVESSPKFQEAMSYYMVQEADVLRAAAIDKIQDREVARTEREKALKNARLRRPDWKDYRAASSAWALAERVKYLAKEGLYFYIGNFDEYNPSTQQAYVNMRRHPIPGKDNPHQVGGLSGEPVFLAKGNRPEMAKPMARICSVNVFKPDDRAQGDHLVGAYYGFQVQVPRADLEAALSRIDGNLDYIKERQAAAINGPLSVDKAAPEAVNATWNLAKIQNRRDNLLLLAQGNPFTLKVEKVFFFNAATRDVFGELPTDLKAQATTPTPPAKPVKSVIPASPAGQPRHGKTHRIFPTNKTEPVDPNL